MTQEWGNDGKDAALLGWGAFTLESAIELQRIVAKYWTRSDIKITVMNNGNVPNSTPRIAGKRVSDNRDEAEDNMFDNDILLILRHHLGKNFSVFWARSSFHFFNLLGSRKVSVNYDSTTVSIRLEILRS